MAGLSPRWLMAALLLLALGAGVLYGVAAWSATWIYDDIEVILNHPPPESVADVAQYFRERHFPGLAYYRPITRSTLLVQKALHGENPRPFHLFNGALAGLLLVVAWGALRRLGVGPWSALAVAALLALHPATSSCVYPTASGRETLQPAVFALATLWASLRWGPRWTVATLVLFTASLFGKEQMVVMPALLLLADALGLGKSAEGPRQGLIAALQDSAGSSGWFSALLRWMDRERWVRYGTMAAVTVAYFGLRQKLFGGDELRFAVLEQPLGPLVSLLYSLQTLFLPFVDLHYEPPFAVWWTPWRAVAGLVLAVVLVLAARRAGASKPLLAFAAGWFVLAQLATANVLYQEAKFSERYVLLAYFAAALVAGLWLSRWERAGQLPGNEGRWVFGIVAGLIVLSAAVSFHRGQFFRDPFSFHAQWAVTNSATEIPRMGLGLDYAERGEPERAELNFREALALKPDYVDGHFNYSNFLADQRRYEEAAAGYRRVVELAPDRFQPRVNLADVLRLAGRYGEARQAYGEALGSLASDSDPRIAELQARRVEMAAALATASGEGVDSWSRAVAAAPEDADLRLRYGNALADLGRLPEALEQFQRAVELDPQRAQGWYNLGTTLLSTGAVEPARESLQRAVELDPDSADARSNLASALAATGRLPEALEHFARAAELAPTRSSSRLGYGTALLATGQPAAAVAELEAGLAALEAEGAAGAAPQGVAPAWLLLGQARAAAGQIPAARQALERALELDPQLDAARQMLERLQS